MLTKHDPVEGDWTYEEGNRQSCEDHVGHIEPTLSMSQPGELGREGQSEQEAKQHLDPETGHPQFLN